MHRTARRLVVALCALGVIPVVAGGSAAGAIDQDLVVSAASGAPGSVIEVSSASCAPLSGEDDAERFLRVLLISGTGSDAVLAGSGFGDGTASLVVPDWLDPAEPGSIEASCVTLDYGFDDYTETTEAYDPVAFDVLAGAGAPTQVRTFSRTELLTGQAFMVDGAGCATSGDVFAGVDLMTGDDLSGRGLSERVADGYGSVEGGAFSAPVALIERSFGYGWSSSNGGRPEIRVDEPDTVIPAGTYTAVTYCETYDDSTGQSLFLHLPPQLIEVTGDAPIDDIDWITAEGSLSADLTGSSCTVGDVTGDVGGFDVAAEQASFDQVQVALDGGTRSPFGIPAAPSSAIAAGRAIENEDWTPFTATPDGEGSWTHEDQAAFDLGVVVAEATCGDPLADGFFYELQLGIIDVPPTVTTTVPQTTVPQTVPAPATAVPGTPTYAG